MGLDDSGRPARPSRSRRAADDNCSGAARQSKTCWAWWRSSKAWLLKQLDIEGAIETLVLAMALRMQGRAVPGRHTVFDQPDTELGQRLLCRAAPRAAIVGQDDLGQAIALEGRLHGVLHGLMAFVVGGMQHHGIARMIVEHRQRENRP